MGLTVTREKSTGGVPIFQQDPQNAQGGFALDTTGLTTGALVPAGTVMGFDESTRKAWILVFNTSHRKTACVKIGHTCYSAQPTINDTVPTTIADGIWS